MEKIALMDEANLGPVMGPYSQGLKYNGIIYTAHCGITAEKGVVSESVYEQTKQAFLNAERILHQGGSSLGAVLKTTVYLTDTEDFAEMNRAYGEMLPELPRPARATVYVKSLSPGVKVEIDFVAAAQN